MTPAKSCDPGSAKCCLPTCEGNKMRKAKGPQTGTEWKVGLKVTQYGHEIVKFSPAEN